MTDARLKCTMLGPPGWRCSCGRNFDYYKKLSEHVRMDIECPLCKEAPVAQLADDELYRWTCGHWIPRGDPSAPIQIRDGTLTKVTGRS